MEKENNDLNEKIKETDESENLEQEESLENKDVNKGNNVLLKKVITVSIIIIAIIVLGNIIFNKFNNDNSIKVVKKVLGTKYYDVSCIDSNCEKIMAIDGDKLSKYKVLLFNSDGKKVSEYKATYDSNSKSVETPVDLSDKYYISETTSIDNGENINYSIKNSKGKAIYQTKNKLSVINDNFVLMEENKKYTILTNKGKEVYSKLDSVDKYLDGRFIQIESNDVTNILNEKGENILDGYTIENIVYNDKKEATGLIIKNIKDNIYNYYSVNKEKVVGNSFNSYDIDNEKIIVTGIENNKRINYELLYDGDQEKIETNEEIIDSIKEKIDEEKYTLYEKSVYDSKQKNVIVDNISSKTLGILNLKNNEYKKIFDYIDNKTYIHSEVSNISTDEQEDKYFKISCSSYYCDKQKTYIYDLTNGKEVYSIEDIKIRSYNEYEDGYKVIRFSNLENNEYSDKYVVFDKNNKNVFSSNDSLIIADKDLLVGNIPSSLSYLYSTKSNKFIIDSSVSPIVVGTGVVYKYDDSNNTIILNSKAEEVIKIPKSDYLKLSDGCYVYIDDNYVKIYNVEKDKTYKYKLKDDEKLNLSSGSMISPFRGAIFINNSKDEYVRVVNFNGEQIKKINNVEISSIKINENNNRVYLIVRKQIKNGNEYGMYVAK